MASTSKLEEDNQKTLEREIRNMVSTLMHRLAQLQYSAKRGSSNCLGDDDKERGSRGITLAGNNTGAVMRADVREKLEGRAAFSDDHEGMQRTPDAYVNSSYQGVNNSIMMNGHYSAQDPGVHNVFDFVEEHGHHKEDHEKLKREKKKKKTKKKNHSNSDYSEEDGHHMEGKRKDGKEYEGDGFWLQR